MTTLTTPVPGFWDDAIRTHGYMPLEQLAGEVDATTDGYALGMTMLHLLTRQEPWRIAQEKPALNVSGPLRAFLDKLVAPDRRARFASAQDALAAIGALGQARAKPRRSWRPVLYAAAAVALAGSGLGVYELASAGRPAEGTLRVTMDPSDAHGLLYVDDVSQSVVVGNDEIPLPAGPHAVEIRFYRDKPCTADVEIEPGHVRWLSCAVNPWLPPTAPPRPVDVAPAPVGKTATLRLLLDRGDSEMPMWIDGTRIDLVSDRQELVVTAGPHHVLVDSERGGCIRDITAVAGKVTEIACHVDRRWLDRLGAPMSPDDLPFEEAPPSGGR